MNIVGFTPAPRPTAMATAGLIPVDSAQTTGSGVPKAPGPDTKTAPGAAPGFADVLLGLIGAFGLSSSLPSSPDAPQANGISPPRFAGAGPPKGGELGQVTPLADPINRTVPCIAVIPTGALWPNQITPSLPDATSAAAWTGEMADTQTSEFQPAGSDPRDGMDADGAWPSNALGAVLVAPVLVAPVLVNASPGGEVNRADATNPDVPATQGPATGEAVSGSLVGVTPPTVSEEATPPEGTDTRIATESTARNAPSTAVTAHDPLTAPSAEPPQFATIFGLARKESVPVGSGFSSSHVSDQPVEATQASPVAAVPLVIPMAPGGTYQAYSGRWPSGSGQSGQPFAEVLQSVPLQSQRTANQQSDTLADAPITTQDTSSLQALSGTAPAGVDATVSTPTAVPSANRLVDPEALMGQVLRHVRVVLAGKNTEVTLHLHPEHLGQVAVKIMFADGAVRAEIAAREVMVKDVLEANLDQLRSRLATQGVHVDQVTVTLGGEGLFGHPGQPHGQGESQRRQSNGWRRAVGGETAEGDTAEGVAPPGGTWLPNGTGRRLNSLA